MPRLLLALLLVIIPLTAVTPPGLCPCWLFAHVAQYHPHAPGQVGHPHSHNYLHENYPSSTAAAMPAALLPAGLFVSLLAALLHWRRLVDSCFSGAGWPVPVDAPPPRLHLLSHAA